MFLQNLASFAVAMSVAVDERKFELKMKLKLNIFVPRKTIQGHPFDLIKSIKLPVKAAIAVGKKS